MTSEGPIDLDIRGMRHLALFVSNLPASRAFYESLFGMKVVWEPDPDNVYLSSGMDNLALHQMSPEAQAAFKPGASVVLDHFGFIVGSPASVERLCERAKTFGTRILQEPKRHRDQSYSCYLADPDGNRIQILYEPTISPLQLASSGEHGT